MATVLSPREARRAYDRIGRIQDSQAFYEDPATDLLLRHGDFESAHAVFELGCGTGRLALRLLAEHLPADARYRAVDLSPRMVSLARERLAPYADRAEVVLTEGDPPTEEPDAAYDRFVSSYVFDLLSEEASRAILREAHRMLRPGGLLCVAGLSTGTGPGSRAVAWLWSRVQARWPALVGGCRPVEVAPLLDPASWTLRLHRKVVAFGVPSEALVAERAQDPERP
jgi:SAM-dependent methyltransferase